MTVGFYSGQSRGSAYFFAGKDSDDRDAVSRGHAPVVPRVAAGGRPR